MHSKAQDKRWTNYLSQHPQLRENVGWNWLAASSDRQVETPSNQPFKQLFAGALGGSLSRTLVAPLDRAITMMQADSGKLKLTTALKNVVSKDGVAGLWKGNFPNVVKIIPRSALQFTVFANMKDFFLLRHKPNADGSSPGRAATCAPDFPGLYL